MHRGLCGCFTYWTVSVAVERPRCQRLPTSCGESTVLLFEGRDFETTCGSAEEANRVTRSEFRDFERCEGRHEHGIVATHDFHLNGCCESAIQQLHHRMVLMFMMNLACSEDAASKGLWKADEHVHRATVGSMGPAGAHEERCMYVCMYVCRYTYIYIYTYTHMHIICCHLVW